MPGHGPEVADVFRRYGNAYRRQHGASLSTAQRQAMAAIESCRTAALGGHVERCDGCGHQRIAYNSCRNRNCPKCQGLARAQWLEDRQAELLDTPYFHVVFTVPEEIATIAFQNKVVVYDILFRAAAETLRTIAADPAHLGAEIGFLAVLHTWGQNLLHHPHLHCLVPGGGIAADGSRWIACRPGFFLPVRVLSRLFRGLFLHYLEKTFAAGKLNFLSAQRHLGEPAAFRRHLAATRGTQWVVYAKRPFAGPRQVLEYVGRYTHRIAISNHRLLSIDEGKVRFRWKDYRHGNQQKSMTLDAGEFIRRFLIHVLPSGFQRIRYFGFLGNCHRARKLALCRELLGMAQAEQDKLAPPEDYRHRHEALTGISLRVCPHCHLGSMLVVEVIPRTSLRPPVPQNTS
ncbi:MAG: IS91 family transposase [Candidatus Eremiobacteraeota bacterium]|nr:IS91 family transposase [Candidatus Eremiobacteraeota bacterium]